MYTSDYTLKIFVDWRPWILTNFIFTGSGILLGFFLTTNSGHPSHRRNPHPHPDAVKAKANTRPSGDRLVSTRQ